MQKQQIIDWLLDGDVSIQYQVWRDLLGKDKKNLQDKIEYEGWGQHFLFARKMEGHWGDRFYQPKWISTHYTLLDLKNLNLSPNNRMVQESIDLVLQNNTAEDGGIQLGPSTLQRSDVCVNGMFLNYATYFKTKGERLYPIVDCILIEVMPDGGFNCRTTRSGATHSSLHTTLSVLEGFAEFQKAGFTYKKNKIKSAIKSSLEFILRHQLFLSIRTGQIIDERFLKLTYPCRWRYDILRAFDFFQNNGVKWDSRMEAALNILLKKRNKEGTWNLSAAHAGQVHFNMEQAGKASRWNTLRVLRVLKHFKLE